MAEFVSKSGKIRVYARRFGRSTFLLGLDIPSGGAFCADSFTARRLLRGLGGIAAGLMLLRRRRSAAARRRNRRGKR